MPIDPDALERFLKQTPPWVPAFKGASPKSLNGWIHDVTGVDFRYKTKPRSYQLEGLAAALYLGQSLLFFDPQMGKTKIAYDWASQLKRSGMWNRQAHKGLVIAHRPRGVDTWDGQAPRHSNLRVTPIYSEDNPRERFLDALEDDSDLIIVAWSTLQALFTEKRPNRKGQPKLYADRDALRMIAPAFELVIIDEIHYAKDHTGLRFAIGEELVARARWRLGLTGTPFGRDPFAIWAQAYLIDGGEALGRSYYFFEAAFGKRAYNHFTKNKTEFVFDKKKLHILEEKLSTISLSYARTEVTDVKVFGGEVPLHMYGDQRAAYLRLIEEHIQRNDDEERSVKNVFVRLRQVSSGYLPFTDDEGSKQTVRFKANPKAEWLADLLAETPNDYPIVVFHEFMVTGRIIEQAAKAAGREYVTLNGHDPDKQAYRRFQRGEVHTLIANSAAGGESIELPMCEFLLFFESPTSPIVRTQAQARPMARGSRPLVMDDLVCSPVERRILAMIAEGRDLLTEVVHLRKALRQRL